tara:strand:- start:629 stop:1249 length:621 start_codon:yes stop_codon:yes gene_type:complete
MQQILHPNLNLFSVKNFLNLTPSQLSQVRFSAFANYAKLFDKLGYCCGNYGAVICADGPNSFFNAIYQKFQQVIKESLCPDLTIVDLPNKIMPDKKDMPSSYYMEDTAAIFAYVSKRDYYASQYHDHENCAVNAVYYPQINEGDSISFWKNSKAHTYYPEQGELLIMPPNLLHKPDKPVSNNFRIALNLQLSKDQIKSDPFAFSYS